MSSSPGSDDESRSIIYQGANISQLEALLGVDHRMITARLAKSGLKPLFKKGNISYYRVAEVAPHIIKPAFDVEEYIKRMDPRELPKILSKEFWAGMKSRQDYEERAGNLWPTERVVNEVGDLFKLIKMSVLLMADAVERTTELSDKQREIVKNLTHGMLEELSGRIQERFTKPDEDQLKRIREEVRQEVLNEQEDEEEL